MNSNIISIDEASQISQRGKIVKYLALIDIIFSLLYILFSPYFFISMFISLIFATCGYYGAKYFNKNQIFNYCIFLLIQNISRIIIFIIYVSSPSYLNYDSINLQIVFINIFSIFINLYINKIIYNFFNLIKNYSQEQLDALSTSPQIVILHSTEEI